MINSRVHIHPDIRVFRLNISRSLTIGILFIIFSVCGTSMAGEKRKVLLISSYHPGFPTFFQQIDGIKAVFGDDIILDVEFMDTKRFSQKENRHIFKDMLSFKLANTDAYDAIMVADDNALLFALDQQNKLFKDMPIVFFGVNNIERALEQNRNPRVTGVVESVSMKDTIDLMTKLLPQSKKIVALVDGTPSGQGDLKLFYRISENISSHEFKDISLSKMSWPDFLKALTDLDEQNSVLLLSAYKDKDGRTRLFDESLNQIKKHFKGPIFHLWRHGLGDGLLGGKIISHFEQGKTAGNIVLQILNGKPVNRIGVINSSPNRYFFDYTELKRHHLSESLLPPGTIFLNKPYSFYQQHKTFIWSVVAFILILSSAFFVAVVNIFRRKQVERQLREREITLRTIIETIPDLVWLKDTDGNYLTCNPKFERFFGAKESEIVGKSDYDFVHRELADFFREKDRLAMAAGKPSINEEEVVFAEDGHKEILETIKTPMYDATGNMIGVLGVSRDITQRKQIENDIQALVESTVGILGQTLFDKTVKRLCEWLGCECAVVGEIVGTSSVKVSAMILDGERVNDYRYVLDGTPFERVLEKGFRLYPEGVCELFPEDRILSHMKAVGYIGIALVGGDKNPIGVLWAMSRSRLDVPKRAEKVITIMAARISAEMEREKSEKALKASEEKFSKAFQNAPLLMTISSVETGRYLDVNEAFVRITGYSQDMAVGSTSVEIGFISDKERKMLIRKLVGKGHIHEIELELKKADGSRLCCLFSGELITVLGKQRLLSLAMDITERKEMEERLQQAQKMESIGNLAGGIAHDFNNILFPIMGLSELLLEDFPPESLAYEKIRQILKAAERGKSLVDQILAFSRMSGHEMMPLRIQHILKEVFKLTRSTIPANIEIARNIQRNCGLVMGDSAQIHQIAMNLITNAYHAVEETGGSISVHLHEITIDPHDLPIPSMTPGTYANLTISDTGYGIDSGHMGKIFEPYFTTKAQGKGTGLGLAVAYGIIKAHGGDIRVQSELGKGSVFDVYFPLMIKSTTPKSPETLKIQPQTGMERILLVDDEKAIILLEKQMLERLGYTVTTFVGSEAALETFKVDPDAFDLVMTDMAMPNMSGAQLAENILAIRSDIPVIICTGFSERMDEEEAERLGISGLLKKPMSKSVMAGMVRNVLDKGKGSSL